MTAVLALGLRLARAGGHLRAWSIVAGNAFGVVLLLVGLALPEALYSDPVERGRNQVALIGVLLFLLVPAAITLVTVGRLSSGVRDRRLAALRLLGLSPWRTRAVAAVENGTLALLGAGVGVGLGVLGFRLVGPVLLEAERVEQLPRLTAVAYLAVALGVTVLSVLVGSASTWEQNLPGRAMAEATRRTPRLWRTAPLAVGLAMMLGVWLVDPNGPHRNVLPVLMLGGATLTVVGIGLVTPLVTSWCARLLVRSDRVAPRLAGRAIQTDPVGPSRVVAGLGVAIFLVVGALAYLGVFENTPQYRFVLNVVGDGPQSMLVRSAEGGPPLEDLSDLEQVAGVEAVIRSYDVGRACDEGSDAEPCGGEVFVGTCAQLAQVMTMTGCDDTQPARIDPDVHATEGEQWTIDDFHADEIDLIIETEQGTVQHAVALTGSPIVMDVLATKDEWVYPPSVEVFIPPQTLAGDLGPVDQVRVIATGGFDVQQRVTAWADAHGYTTITYPLNDLEILQNVRVMIWLLCGVVLGAGLLLFALTAADRARERRRHVARQVMVGVPARVLRSAQGLQLLIPVLATSALALLSGAVLARGFAQQMQLLVAAEYGGLLRGVVEVLALIGPQSWLVLGGMIALAVLLAVGSTVPLIRTRLRPELLRRE